jgi:beta-glucanase (GH16 family)
MTVMLSLGKNRRFMGGFQNGIKGVPLVLAFGLIGWFSLHATHAATFAATKEAESGTTTGNYTAGATAGASGGASVKFGATPTPPTGGCQPVAKASGGTWNCTWSDEFNGTSLDRNTWRIIPYGLGDTCQSDDDQHAKVTGGVLHLLATQNSATDSCRTQWGLGHTGGFIETQGNFSQKFGRFEMRAKLPPQDGTWPGYWLLPDDDSYDGEIDILESYGGRVEQGGDVGDFTLHVPAAGPGPQKTCRIYPNYSDDFHTYTFEWSATNMRVLYDGVQCANFTGVSDAGTSPPAFPATFTTKPYHILLDLAVQNWWPPASNTVYPMDMQVDYVRVWQ